MVLSIWSLRAAAADGDLAGGLHVDVDEAPVEDLGDPSGARPRERGERARFFGVVLLPPAAYLDPAVRGRIGLFRALEDVTLEVREGEVVTLLGRNGAGKTTTLKSVMGIIGKRTGSILGFPDFEMLYRTMRLRRAGPGPRPA